MTPRRWQKFAIPCSLDRKPLFQLQTVVQLRWLSPDAALTPGSAVRFTDARKRVRLRSYGLFQTLTGGSS